nr:hypothetical protein [uncultured Blautia sp.]
MMSEEEFEQLQRQREEYKRRHSELQQNMNDEIRYRRRRESEKTFEFYRERKRLNNPGKSDEELGIDKPFINENMYDFWDKETIRLSSYFKKLFRLK